MPLGRVDVFDIAHGGWITDGGAPMPTPASFFSSTQVGRYLYTAGGFSGDIEHNVNQTQRYDMVTNTWEVGPIFTSARALGEMKATSMRLFMVGGDVDGGDQHGATDLIEVLDLAAWPAGEWTVLDEKCRCRTFIPA
jgi:hypothetical protein